MNIAAIFCAALLGSSGVQASARMSQDKVVQSAQTAGQRQTREVTAHEAGIEPLARVNNRIENRIQSRVSNRMSRDYRSPTDVASSFKAASERTRRTDRNLRR